MANQIYENSFHLKVVNLLREKWRTDLLITTGDDTDHRSAIPVHKLVLASRSELFKQMYESDKFNDSNILTISGIKQEVLETFVDFMYGKCSSAKLRKYARSLYIAAGVCDVKDLLQLCSSELRQSLDVSNALDYLELSQRQMDKRLYDTVSSFIVTRINLFVDSTDFKSLVARNPSLDVKIKMASLQAPMKDINVKDSTGRKPMFCWNLKFEFEIKL